jgi:hypothetical protein
VYLKRWIRNVFVILVGKILENELCERQRRYQEDIKMDVTEIGYDEGQ